MDRRANYRVIEKSKERIVLKDIGPWDRYMTITNAAESVVLEVDRNFLGIGTRRLFYYDSDGVMTELIVKDGKFAGFAPVVS